MPCEFCPPEGYCGMCGSNYGLAEERRGGSTDDMNWGGAANPADVATRDARGGAGPDAYDTEQDKPVFVREETDERADEHYIEAIDQTVAEANPDYPDDDAVVIASYAPGGKTYAFPESRLTDVEDA